jgi:hypothetical protein
MAGLRGTLAALMIGNALVASPAVAQSSGFSSLTHTVSVTVPARVKVRVASLSAATLVSAGRTVVAANANGLSLTVNATQPWVLAIGSSDAVQAKNNLQWSRDGRSQYSELTTRGAPIASGASSFEATPVSMFFRNADSASSRRGQSETVVLTVSAP